MDSPRSSESFVRASVSGLSLPISSPRTYSSRDSLEHQMKREAENVLREWNTNVKTRTEDTLRIRSGSVGAPGFRRSRSRSRPLSQPSSSSPIPLSLHPTGSEIRFFKPEVEIIERDSTERLGSTDVFESPTRNNQFVTCPSTGQRMFRIELDVAGFTNRDVSIQVSDGTLTVHGVRQENNDGRKSTNEFCRKIKLPRGVVAERLRSFYINNILIIEIPSIFGSSTAESLNTSSVSSGERKISLNLPTVLTTHEGEKRLYLIVEVGRVFKASDVTVKVSGQRKIVVSAERKENLPSSSLKASLLREFEIEGRIDKSSMDAGFINNTGLLKITAKIDPKENGHDRSISLSSNRINTESLKSYTIY